MMMINVTNTKYRVPHILVLRK